ncbi:hypothetical protein CHELA40_11966 [Chelatococcus asaccharovorans]|nr:hypothetical protein CHELA40_11966 [Chelatococcus asaccharovorans]CAH1683713.1 hypothetical protein CHELA17_63638 [Chelatococcus asaccharovorans]
MQAGGTGGGNTIPILARRLAIIPGTTFFLDGTQLAQLLFLFTLIQQKIFAPSIEDAR